MNMRKIICLFVLILFLSGCFHHRAPRKFDSGGPHEEVVTNYKKNTPQQDAHLYQAMGIDYFNQKDLAKAEEFFERAVKSDSSLYWSWCCLGLLNIEQQKGYQYLKKSAEIKPDFPVPYYWMAYYHCRIREDQQAIHFFKKYIELAKDIPGEVDRVVAAKETLQELESGKDARMLKLIRKPLGNK